MTPTFLTVDAVDGAICLWHGPTPPTFNAPNGVWEGDNLVRPAGNVVGWYPGEEAPDLNPETGEWLPANELHQYGFLDPDDGAGYRPLCVALG